MGGLSALAFRGFSKGGQAAHGTRREVSFEQKKTKGTKTLLPSFSSVQNSFRITVVSTDW
jgi:hypothetical protein